MTDGVVVVICNYDSSSARHPPVGLSDPIGSSGPEEQQLQGTSDKGRRVNKGRGGEVNCSE